VDNPYAKYATGEDPAVDPATLIEPAKTENPYAKYTSGKVTTTPVENPYAKYLSGKIATASPVVETPVTPESIYLEGRLAGVRAGFNELVATAADTLSIPGKAMAKLVRQDPEQARIEFAGIPLTDSGTTGFVVSVGMARVGGEGSPGPTW